MKFSTKKLILLIWVLLLSFTLTAQDYLEYGDAPEGAIAYPSTGAIGSFPTCVTVTLDGFVQHNNFGAFLGPGFDFEFDGNAGSCPGFNPYDMDECFLDGDAGLLIPEPFTIDNSNQVVPCPNSIGTALGSTCQIAIWGQNIDIDVTNQMPGATVGLMNVVIDWDQNGHWGDLVTCPSGQIPEHVLQNFAVPNGFVGPLSILAPPNFTIGPNPGYYWGRFTISEQPVNINWDGNGVFEDGESEDYLLWVIISDEYDYGDAPEGDTAYPSLGIIGNFPTCSSVGPAGYFVNHRVADLFLGLMVDGELDGNAGLCNPFTPPYDNDECFQDGDAGLIIPDPYTIDTSGGTYSVVPCTGQGTPLDTICLFAQWGTDIDIDIVNNTDIDAFMNVIFDWNQDGYWADDTTIICNDTVVPEHVLVDFPVPAGYTGPLSGLLPPDFQVGPEAGYVWSRFTISDAPVILPWDGSGEFMNGESEDYLMEILAEEGEEYDFGDAPEGDTAYPSLGIIGNFPTCSAIGPAGYYVNHGIGYTYLGPAVDLEPDGNAGLCNPFQPPYDNDECFQDGDAGLIFPDPYTIDTSGGNYTVVPCLSQGTPLDTTCHYAIWGTEIDIDVTHNMDLGAYMNVIIDWNHDGYWADDTTTTCSGTFVPEHVLVDFPIPPMFVGPLSNLTPPNFLVGPESGYVWGRFTISDQPVGIDWDGSGSFLNGESEDYLLEVVTFEEAYDYGDAPEGATAYPSLAVTGNFPTCIVTGPAGFVRHNIMTMYFGPTVDSEIDGNAGLCSPFLTPYDNDECFQDGDAGLITPDPYTIVTNVVVPCTGNGTPIDTVCQWAQWGPDVDIDVNNNSDMDAFVNVLFDWNQSGNWADDTTTTCSGNMVPEHVLIDFGIPPGYVGPLSLLFPPKFQVGPDPGFVWARFTISDQPVGPEWDGDGEFMNGESEDYLIEVVLNVGIEELYRGSLDIRISPNPASSSTNISYYLRKDADVEINIYNSQGRFITQLLKENQPQGIRTVTWSGTDQYNRLVSNGVYLVEIRLYKASVGRAKVVLMH
jgi:hypothetical protein